MYEPLTPAQEDRIEALMEDAKFASNTVTSFLNSSSLRERQEAFIRSMGRDHRTLQQSFTRLCLMWLEHVASEQYRTDMRNEASKRVATRLTDLWNADDKERNFGMPASQHLPYI